VTDRQTDGQIGLWQSFGVKTRAKTFQAYKNTHEIQYNLIQSERIHTDQLMVPTVYALKYYICKIAHAKILQVV